MSGESIHLVPSRYIPSRALVHFLIEDEIAFFYRNQDWWSRKDMVSICFQFLSAARPYCNERANERGEDLAAHAAKSDTTAR